MKLNFNRVKIFLSLVFVFFISFDLVSAYVASSTTYKIQNDSINFGGVYSSSTSYQIRDSLGESGTGKSNSSSYYLSSGYRQMESSSIYISSPSDISMTALSSSQNTAVGSSSWTIITDNSSGYTASVSASSKPALKSSGSSFDDYTESVSGVKETWSVSSAYEFGFSAYGNDVSGYGSGSSCESGTNIPSTTLLWEGFEGTTEIQVASSTSATVSSGEDVTLCVATEQDSVSAPSGTYSTTITITVLPL